MEIVEAHMAMQGHPSNLAQPRIPKNISGSGLIEGHSLGKFDSSAGLKLQKDGDDSDSDDDDNMHDTIDDSISTTSTEILKAWILSAEHFCHPYPTPKEKKELQAQTGLSSLQLKNWFTNARRRTWRPLMQSILNGIDLEPILGQARMKHNVPNVFMHNGAMIMKDIGGPFCPKAPTEVLKAWILSDDNFIHPYPSLGERKALAGLTRLSAKQLKNWFTNARRRIWKPLMRRVMAKIHLAPILEAAAAKVLIRTRPSGGGGGGGGLGVAGAGGGGAAARAGAGGPGGGPRNESLISLIKFISDPGKRLSLHLQLEDPELQQQHEHEHGHHPGGGGGGHLHPHAHEHSAHPHHHAYGHPPHSPTDGGGGGGDGLLPPSSAHPHPHHGPPPLAPGADHHLHHHHHHHHPPPGAPWASTSRPLDVLSEAAASFTRQHHRGPPPGGGGGGGEPADFNQAEQLISESWEDFNKHSMFAQGAKPRRGAGGLGLGGGGLGRHRPRGAQATGRGGGPAASPLDSVAAAAAAAAAAQAHAVHPPHHHHYHGHPHHGGEPPAPHLMPPPPPYGMPPPEPPDYHHHPPHHHAPYPEHGSPHHRPSPAPHEGGASRFLPAHGDGGGGGRRGHHHHHKPAENLGLSHYHHAPAASRSSARRAPSYSTAPVPALSYPPTTGRSPPLSPLSKGLSSPTSSGAGMLSYSSSSGLASGRAEAAGALALMPAPPAHPHHAALPRTTMKL